MTLALQSSRHLRRGPVKEFRVVGQFQTDPLPEFLTRSSRSRFKVRRSWCHAATGGGESVRFMSALVLHTVLTRPGQQSKNGSDTVLIPFFIFTFPFWTCGIPPPPSFVAF